ncbi:hypothetical protein B4110_3596 [Parageobacillus toebii]|uniref:Uncharacterized protein n=1 Tax=Parageobacillus toebii TaxID=153151 RepID=A0A150N7Y3_9BACL|nr:hypothetical protein B4110_3596 [Parageobacillus toebii]
MEERKEAEAAKEQTARAGTEVKNRSGVVFRKTGYHPNFKSIRLFIK